MKHGHIELAHPVNIQFDCIVDAIINKPSKITPQLTGNNGLQPPVIDPNYVTTKDNSSTLYSNIKMSCVKQS